MIFKLRLGGLFSFIGIEKIQDYFEIAQRRVFADVPLFVDAMAEQVVASK